MLGAPPRGREHTLARLEGELRVHRHEPVAELERGVHALPRAELVLHLVMAGQDLPQQLLQPHLADRAAELRDLQQVLHLAHGLAHRLEALRHLSELPQALAHVLEHARLLGAPRRQRLRHLLLRGDELVEPRTQLDQLLLDQPGGPLAAGAAQQHHDEQRGEDDERDRDGGRHARKVCDRSTPEKAPLKPWLGPGAKAAKFSRCLTPPSASPSPAISPASSVTSSCGGGCTTPMRRSSSPTWGSRTCSTRGRKWGSARARTCRAAS